MIARYFKFLFVIIAVHNFIAVYNGFAARPVLAEDISHPTHQVNASSAAENAGELYVAVMGEIENPGTYLLDSSSLTLRTVIRKAGGLNRDASMVVRIIRRGQSSSFKMFVSESSDNPLMSGDLLIADSKISASNASHTINVMQDEPETVRANYEEQSESTDVQVALLNVLDYPVVLKLKADQANPSYIVQWLKQPVTLLQHTRTITQDIRQRQASLAGRAASRLSDASVLVFEPGVINRKQLPSTLPKPIDSEIAAGARSGLIGMPTGQSMELNNVGQHVFTPRTGSFEADSTTSRATSPPRNSAHVPVREDFDHKRYETPAAPAVTSRQRIAMLPPWSGPSRIRNSSIGTESASEDSSNEPIPDPDDIRPESGAASLKMAAPLTIAEPVESATRAFTNGQMTVAMMFIAILTGAALLLRRTLEQASSIHNFVPAMVLDEPAQEAIPEPVIAPPTGKSVLELLLGNELPIEIEAFEFPEGIALQGQIVPKPNLRLDGAQSILKQNRPHFAGTDRSIVNESMQEVIAQVDSPESGSIRRPHFMATQQQKLAAKQPKATSATVASDSASSNERSKTADPPRAPLAKALFQLEKGGRS